MNRIVAIHLVASGSHARDDAVIEIAAARLVGDRIEDRFQTLVSPRQTPPALLLERSGISADALARAPAEHAACAMLAAFVEDDPLVAHAADVPLSQLAARGFSLANPVIDARELARWLLPTAPAFDLETLCRRCRVERDPAGRAAGEAAAVAALWGALMTRLRALPLPVVSSIAALLEPTHHALRPLFEEAEKLRIIDAFAAGEKRRVADLMPRFAEIIAPRRPYNPRVPPQRLDTGVIAAEFGPAGALARALPAYEQRREQVRMVEEVCEAYNNGALLLCEAGTGTGKSLAYLLPSIAWARANRERIVVSTNTKNLQEQLFFKDLPLLERALGGGFRRAIIKGRANYLCARKLVNLLDDADRELDDDERRRLPPLITWAVATETGDISENAGFLGGFSSELWSRLSTAADECLGPGCRMANGCFVRRARALSLNADVVVANHAVVFSELGIEESAVLPPYRHIIFDEAHNVEAVATENLAVRAAPGDVARILRRLHHGRRDARAKGLFANIRYRLDHAGRSLGDESRALLVRELEHALNLFPEIGMAADEFFNAVGLIFPANGESDKVRYRPEALPDCWDTILKAGERLGDKLERLARRLDAMREELEGDAAEMARGDEFVRSLTAQAAALREFISAVLFLVRVEEGGYVYWAEQQRRRTTNYALCAAPLDIGAMMNELVYKKKDTVIFSSATLAVNKQFHFMRERLGLNAAESGRIREANVGSPFDFPRQVLFGVPMFLPPPDDGSGAFTDRFAELALDVLRATHGRGLVLFTSYRMLNRAQAVLREALGAEGIRVLAQGIDGERSHITALFEHDVHSVLCGTQSFWEGVDVVGEALSCLILAKLPFHVFTEPIIEGRCELVRSRGEDPFMRFTVPSAIIRLKQGFGRLIRAGTDRGIILIADQRLATRGYGRQFLNSLPTRARFYQRPEQLVSDIAAFMADEGEPEAERR